MFCPECGSALPDAGAHFCPFCGSRIVIPTEIETPEIAPLTAREEAAQPQEPQKPVTRSKICSAALLLGAGTLVFGMFTLILRILNADLRVLGAAAAVTFFLAPLACIFGLAGIIVRAANPQKRGLPSAIVGLLLGLSFGLLAVVCLLGRILAY